MTATKRVAFFHDMITGEFHVARTFGRDNRYPRISASIREALGLGDDDAWFVDLFAELLEYTVSLEFNWSDDAPEHYKTIEKLWQMKQQGIAPEKLFEFFSENVPTLFILGDSEKTEEGGRKITVRGWTHALAMAHTVWKPAHEKMAQNVPDEVRNDPNG